MDRQKVAILVCLSEPSARTTWQPAADPSKTQGKPRNPAGSATKWACQGCGGSTRPNARIRAHKRDGCLETGRIRTKKHRSLACRLPLRSASDHDWPCFLLGSRLQERSSDSRSLEMAEQEEVRLSRQRAQNRERNGGHMTVDAGQGN